MSGYDTSTCGSGRYRGRGKGEDGEAKEGIVTKIKNFYHGHKTLVIAIIVVASIVIIGLSLGLGLGLGLKRSGTGTTGVTGVTGTTGTSGFVPGSILGGPRQQFRSNMSVSGGNPFGQDGCAGGSSCSVNTGNGNSLGFGFSPFAERMTVSEDQKRVAEALLQQQQRSNMSNKDNMWPFKSNMGNKEHMTPDEAKAQADALKAYEIARSTSTVGARQNAVLNGCENPWDSMATEEAKVLGAIGVFKPSTPGMAPFTRTVNPSALTDAQLEMILQGGEPMTIAPASMQDMNRIAADRRSEGLSAGPFDTAGRQVTSVPPRSFQ